MVITVMKPIPFIDTNTVQKGTTTVYALERNQTQGFNGTVSDIKPEEVTLTGFRGNTGVTVKYTAAQLKADDYQVFKFAQNMSEIKIEGVIPWTKDTVMEVIDPDICKASYFVMYKRQGEAEYTNGIILSVEREKMTISSVVNNKNTVVTLTIADIKKSNFTAEVSPVIFGGTGGENYGYANYFGKV